MKHVLYLLVAAALLFAWSVPAAANKTGPVKGYEPGLPGDPNDDDFLDVKSPPLRWTGVFNTTWAWHDWEPLNNYCGFLFDLQYDGSEVTAIKLRPRGRHLWIEVPNTTGLYTFATFPGSQPGMTTVEPLAVWIDPAIAMNSGTAISSSDLNLLFEVYGHVKGTTTAQNSDVDITVSAWQIVHIASSGTYVIEASDWVYKTTGGMNWALEPGHGRWFHQPTTVTTFVPASAFVATNFWIANVAGYGLEHQPEGIVPVEPLSVLLVIGGVGAIAAGRLWRKRA